MNDNTQALEADQTPSEIDPLVQQIMSSRGLNQEEAEDLLSRLDDLDKEIVV
jgi:hypothetical protein